MQFLILSLLLQRGEEEEKEKGGLEKKRKGVADEEKKMEKFKKGAVQEETDGKVRKILSVSDWASLLLRVKLQNGKQVGKTMCIIYTSKDIK